MESGNNLALHSDYAGFDGPNGDPGRRGPQGVQTFTDTALYCGKEMVLVKMKKTSQPKPKYETLSSAGADLIYNGDEEKVLQPMERALFGTGLYLEIPSGYEAQIRPRSGLALKHGITVLNTPGTIDADYRGEVGVILANLSNEPYTVKPGDRIAQIVFSSYKQAYFIFSETLSDTERGEGGFGHTGK